MISKAKLGDFDNITIFSDEYLLVERKGLFNLIDNSGEYVSKTWYKEITKNNGGGADFVEVKDNRRVQLRSIPLVRTYGQVRTALNNTSILSRIDTRCIAIISPYKVFSSSSSRYITIIAKVTIFGKELLLGKNGKLYEKNYDEVREYNLPEFFISLTDINRLVDVADNFNRIYDSTYDTNSKRLTTNCDDLVQTKTAFWIFGFDYSGTMQFNTSCKTLIKKSETQAWGGDTIKVRIDTDILPELYREKIIDKLLNNLEFEKWNKNGTNMQWYTKQYTLDELNEIFDDVNYLTQKLNFVKR